MIKWVDVLKLFSPAIRDWFAAPVPCRLGRRRLTGGCGGQAASISTRQPNHAFYLVATGLRERSWVRACAIWSKHAAETTIRIALADGGGSSAEHGGQVRTESGGIT